MEFSDLRFNEKEKLLFVKEALSGRLSHAYIIEGEEGTGKFTFSLFAAAVILCEGESKPCGKCSPCKKIAADSHPDLFIFGPEKDAAQITVNAVREIKKSVYLLPNEGSKKVYIIKEAQKMNIQAQNALLKFFEDPPASAVFFLLTDKREALLPTVISRGQIITLYPSKKEDIFAYIKEKNPKKSDDEILSAVNMCEGSIGKAITLTEKKYVQMRTDVSEFAENVFNRNAFGTVSFFKSKKYDRIKAKDFLLTLFTLFSDVLRAKEKLEKFSFLPKEKAMYYAKQTTELKASALCEETMRTYEAVDANANINLTLTSFGAKINEIQ